MPNYIAEADLNNLLSPKERIQLSTDGAEIESDSTVLTWAIDSAESLIDTFISSQVSVPMATPTAFIKQMSLSLAKYYLFLRRGHVSDDLQAEYDRIASTDYNKPGFLFLIMMGKLLVDAAGNGVEVIYGSRPRNWADDSMLGV